MLLQEQHNRLGEVYEFLRLDNTTLPNKSEHMLTKIKGVTKKSDVLAEEARVMTTIITPTQPNGRLMLKFLGKLHTKLEY